MEADTGVLAATQKLVRSAKLASQRPQRGFYLKRLDQWQANEYGDRRGRFALVRLPRTDP